MTQGATEAAAAAATEVAAEQPAGGVERLRAFVRGQVVDAPPTEDPQLGPDWEPTPGRIGICCSGGGIRSASYNLGALQALQDRGVLARAEYLASVSGGGYTAGAMTMLAGSPESDLVWGQGRPLPFAPGSPEEDHLRRHSDYLAAGLAGKVRLVSRLLLGLLINLAIVGTIVVVAARLGGQLAAWLRPELVVPAPRAGAQAPAFLDGMALACALLAAVGFVLLLATAALRLDEELHAGFVRASTGMLAIAGAAAAVLFVVPWLIEVSRGLASAVAQALDALVDLVGDLGADSSEAGASGVSGVPGAAEVSGASGAAGVSDDQRGTDALTAILALVAAAGVPTLLGGALHSIVTEHASRLARLAAWVVAPVLVGMTFVAVADDAAAAGAAFTGRHVLWLVVPACLFVLLYAVSDLTAWSLHPFYKRRLSTAFALERFWRNADGGRARPDDRRPGGRLAAGERDYDQLVPLSRTRPPDGVAWPELVICAAANISDAGVTPPGRGAVSFTFERDWVGGPEVGYLRTTRFEEALGETRRQDATLPAAIAISGAALSPSMGKLTIPSLRFLLALVNARLGVWLPNPRHVAALHERYAERVAFEVEQAGPGASASGFGAAASVQPASPRLSLDRPRITWLLRELIGWNRRDGRYLYVTDGGHWENLGLVELLRRGCTEIYCIDAAGDESDTFFTIGEAIALARSELGVEIDLDPTPMRPDPANDGPPAGAGGGGGGGYAPVDSVIGTLRYLERRLPDGRTRPETRGRIVFVKAAVMREDSWDVRAYKERDPTFPNHSLVAQMFADQTFESYRALGYAAAIRAVERTA